LRGPSQKNASLYEGCWCATSNKFDVSRQLAVFIAPKGILSVRACCDFDSRFLHGLLHGLMEYFE
jgi:hypothetical protein